MRFYARFLAMAMLLVFSVHASSLRAAKETLKPVNLKCEYQENPQVLDAMAPRLAWTNQLTDEGLRGEKQTAWQVCVASSKELLLSGESDLWDSGKVKEEGAPYIIYKGKALQSAQTCWWRVRVWNAKGKASQWSEPACWTMGLLKDSDWKAKWIGAPWEGEVAREYVKGNPYYPAPLLRKNFTINKEVKEAKVFVTGLGYFELYINGKKVGKDVLSPNQTNYDKRETLLAANRTIKVDDALMKFSVMYLGYDVTGMLNKGENAMGCILGNGFYNPLRNWTAAYKTPRFISQLMITYEDGTTETVVSDESWKAHESAIRKNDIYEGEHYDARCEIENWANADCDVSTWKPVVLRQTPKGKLTAQNGPADRIMERLNPVEIKPLGNNAYEVDFGEEISGWLRLKDVRGQRGDTIRIKYLSESPNGENFYVLKGGEKESYATRFTWYVFRKVQIENWPGELNPKQIVAEAVYSDTKQTGNFSCSNELFNSINKIWLRSQRDNMHGSIASDCPHRERSAYTGDGQVACVTVMHNLDATAFYNKWIKDIRDAQNPETGYVPNGAPWQPGCGGGVPWGAAMNIMPWEYYLHFGDRQLLEENYEAMKGQLRYMETWKTDEGIMFAEAPEKGKKNYWMCLGDWCPPFTLPYDHLVHTFYWWRCAQLTAKAAKALGKEEDCKKYENLAEEIKKAFHKKYYNADQGSYGLYGSNVFALKMGVPAEVKDKVVKALRAETEMRGNHLTTGIFGTQFFFEVLAENGLNDLAYTVMNQRDFPSYGYWIEQGATTTWEQWNGENSRNHPMFGGGIVWFYRVLAGVKASEKAPGFKHFEISPMIPSELNHASYSLHTVYGEVKSAWKKNGENMEMEVKVPVGCTAAVKLPVTKETFSLTEQGKQVKKLKGVKWNGVQDGHVCFTLPAGSYRLHLTY